MSTPTTSGMPVVINAERISAGAHSGWREARRAAAPAPKPVDIEVPRDRNGTFEPKLIPKHQRRLEGFNDIVLGLVSRGMTARDVQSHLAQAYQVDVSPELVSKITDAVLPELRVDGRRARPLGSRHPLQGQRLLQHRLRDEEARGREGVVQR